LPVFGIVLVQLFEAAMDTLPAYFGVKHSKQLVTIAVVAENLPVVSSVLSKFGITFHQHNSDTVSYSRIFCATFLYLENPHFF
jgi:hypothetical protein